MSQRETGRGWVLGEQLSRPHREEASASRLLERARVRSQTPGLRASGARAALLPGGVRPRPPLSWIPQGLLPGLRPLSPAWKPALPLPCAPPPSPPNLSSLWLLGSAQAFLHCPEPPPPPARRFPLFTGSTFSHPLGARADRASGLTEAALQEHRGKAWSCPPTQRA